MIHTPRDNIQERLINKPYINEVTLRGQKLPLKCTDPIFTEFKDLFPFSIVSKFQEAGSILKIVFALSK